MLPIKHTFPADFFAEEIKCGYCVSPKLKKIWAVEIDLLSELLRVCGKYGIKVQVFAGTLLGAVRHKGMIPWDDDIDVAMSRSDWNRLCAVAGAEFTHPYFFQTALSDRRRYTPYARLRNSLTTGIITGAASPDYNNGIFIDIFPLDGIGDSKQKRTIQTIMLRVVTKCCTSYYGLTNSRGAAGRAISVLLFPFIRIFPYRFWIWLHGAVSSMWTRHAKFVGLIGSFQFGERYKMESVNLDRLTKLPFENLKVPCPEDYDTVLHGIYGDYTKYPNVKDRGAWHLGKIFFDPERPYQDYFKSGKFDGYEIVAK